MSQFQLSSGMQEVVKWVALALMAVDHLAVALLMPGSGEYVAARLLGRLAWPLFAALVAYNLEVRRVPVRRYLVPLAVMALASQPFYAALVGSAVAPWNIFATILAGVCLAAVLYVPNTLRTWGLAVLALVLVVLLGPGIDYGTAGALLIPAWVLALRWPNFITASVLVAALLAQNWGTIGAVVPLAVPALLALAAGVRLTIGRAPRWFGYAFYPLHLLFAVAVRGFL